MGNSWHNSKRIQMYLSLSTDNNYHHMRHTAKDSTLPSMLANFVCLPFGAVEVVNNEFIRV